LRDEPVRTSAWDAIKGVHLNSYTTGTVSCKVGGNSGKSWISLAGSHAVDSGFLVSGLWILDSNR